MMFEPALVIAMITIKSFDKSKLYFKKENI